MKKQTAERRRQVAKGPAQPGALPIKVAFKYAPEEPQGGNVEKQKCRMRVTKLYDSMKFMIRNVFAKYAPEEPWGGKGWNSMYVTYASTSSTHLRARVWSRAPAPQGDRLADVRRRRPGPPRGHRAVDLRRPNDLLIHVNDFELS